MMTLYVMNMYGNLPEMIAMVLKTPINKQQLKIDKQTLIYHNFNIIIYFFK